MHGTRLRAKRFWIVLCCTAPVVGCDSSEPTSLPDPVAWMVMDVPSDEQLLDVCFANSLIGFAVGENGTILRTDDAGLSWESQNSGFPTSHFQAVHCVDSLTVVVAGGEGTDPLTSVIRVLRSDDGGFGWRKISPDSLGFLAGVFFASRDVGTVVGQWGMILHTLDGGNTWFSQGIGLTNKPLTEVRFESAQVGMIVGDHIALRTIDGGTSWEFSEDPVHTLFSFDFSSSGRGVGVGIGGAIDRTTDGGRTWSYEFADVFSDLHGITFVDEQRGYAVGGNSILFSSDGGQTWIKQTAERAGYRGYFGVWFIDHATGVVVGDGGTILRTVTAGM